MTSKAQSETQTARREAEYAGMAEAFERREFSEEELEAMRKTRRTTPR